MSDFISREAALSAQNKSMNLAEMRERLIRIPAADVRPNKTGRWIKVAALAPFEQDDFKCSECDSWPWWCGVTEDILPNFCPNCGADMRPEIVGEANNRRKSE